MLEMSSLLQGGSSDEEISEKKMRLTPKVAIVQGEDWLEQCDRIPKVEKRVNLLQFSRISLICLKEWFNILKV